MQPEAGWASKVKVERVIDGDTILVSVTRIFPIRVRNLRCAEKNEVGGLEAKNAASNLLNNAKEILVFIPAGNDLLLTDVNTFNRIIGDLYVDGVSFQEWMINNGYGVVGSKEGVT
jgi:endonuclease YncB( thermonuclease family)